MSFTTPIVIPLVKGLDLSKSPALGEQDLVLAQNVDFSVQGEVRGRPSRGAADPYQVRVGTGFWQYTSAATLADTGFTPNGLMRLRDATAERAMLGTDGRLFVHEGSEWKDRGAFACMRVDRPHVYFTQPTDSLIRHVTAQDFGGATAEVGLEGQMSLLNPSTLGFERYTASSVTTGWQAGTSARCGTVTAALYRQTTGNKLFVILRSNGAGSLTEVQIAADAAGASNDGDAPVICCDADQTVFFVVYQTTTANQYKVLRVDTSGTVTATFTGSLTGINGHWVSNSSVAEGVVVVGLTNADGLTIKNLTATTLTDLATDSTHGTAGCDAREVVVGVESGTRVWWAYRQEAAAVAGLRVGFANPASAASASLAKNFSSVASDASAIGVGYYTALHQPIRFGGRMYLTVAVTDVNIVAPTAGGHVATWYTLDLSNMSVGTAVGPFDQPTLVARGRTDGTALRASTTLTFRGQPEGAVLLADDTGWTFPSIDWATYETDAAGNTAGQQAATVLNKVRRSGPRCVLAGGATLFSGSVPRALAGDQCYEAGFPALRPILTTNPQAAGGTLAAGSYTVYTCWRYIDGAGQVHRSAVSASEQSVPGAASYIDVYVQTPYFTERPDGEVVIEVYSTGVDPATGDPAYLQAVVTPSTTAGSTLYSLGLTATVVTNTEGVYILDDEFAHVTPSADGGIAALGRRVWIADHDTVYASLLLQPRRGVAWNDEGSLSVSVPAGAGSIVALEGMDDKLIVFCERGVYAIQDGGPNNIGVGPDIAFPIQLSDLGCAGPRSTCNTDRGVAFCSPLDADDPQRGGPWLLDRSLSLTERKYLGAPAMEYFRGDGSWVPEVAFAPERQQLYVSVPVSDEAISMATYGAAEGSPPAYVTIPTTNTGVVVIDMRQSKWSTWSAYDAVDGDLRSIAVVGGCLWELRDEPRGYTEAPGSSDETFPEMVIRTTHLSSDGRDGLGWARCRAISVLGPVDTSGDYDLLMVAWMDQTRVFSSGLINITEPTPSLSSTWPGSRTAPEWRLPVQKCGSMQVELRCSTHNPRWSAIRLDVQPLPRRAPASSRT